MKKDYKVSVIIAVFNAEEYLKESIESVVNQTIGFKSIELILVNDGSTDKSLSICNEYAKKYSNIIVIDKKNGGVSSARNAGIKKANGKYIMILDSDDFLDSKSISYLYSFMEENDVNISSCTLMNYYPDKTINHFRNKLYSKNTGIYYINEFPYISQSTINIIFKNKFDNNNIYDEKMKLAEDEKFNTELIMNDGKIGFCKEAIYYYRKHEGNVTSNYQNPFYCYKDVLNYFYYLINTYKVNELLPPYIQNLIIQNLNWRITKDWLIPYFLDNKQIENYMNELKNILKYIDSKTIINKPNMEKYNKMYCLNLKNSKLESRLHENHFELYADNIKFDSLKRVAVLFNKMKHHGNKLEILGALRTSLFFVEEPTLMVYILLKNKDIKVITPKLFKSNLSCHKSKMETAKIYGFDLELDMNNVKRVYFKIKMGDYEYSPAYEFSKFVPFNKKIGYRSYIYDNKIISINEKYLRIRKKEVFDSAKIRLKKLLILLQNHKIKTMFYRLLANFYNKSNEVWLYNDSHGVYDNGYVQFLHDEKINDGVKRFYIYDDKFETIVNKFNSVSKNKLVKYGSLKHVLLFINSNKILSSYNNLSAYCPVYKSNNYYRDLLHYDLIYLQHGILYADLLKLYSNETNEFEKVVISTDFEYDNLLNKYNYTENNFIKSGMPRLDLINLNSKPENKILFAPTWRAHLIGGLINNRREIFPDKFIQSDYFIKINELINSEKLNKLLEDNNLVFELKLHPIFKDYVYLFNSNFERIKISADKINLDEYKLFITDYSSYMFDFVYLNRPILYFLPDDLEFKAGLHTYRKLDLPHEDGFGSVSYKSEDLIVEINKIVKNDFVAEEKYAKRIDQFFISREANHRDNLYHELIKKDKYNIVETNNKKNIIKKKKFINLYSRFLKIIPLNKKKVFFISDAHDKLSGNFQKLYNNLPSKYKKIVCLKSDRRDIVSNKTTLRMYFDLATSKYIILDDLVSVMSDFNFRDSQKIVQLWHGAGAYKKFGYARLKSRGGDLKSVHTGYSKYTHVTSSSEAIRQIYADAFDINVEKVKATGCLRTDMFFDKKYVDSKKNELYEKYPFMKNKKVILFAPTFRGDFVDKKREDGGAYYDFSKLDLAKIYNTYKDEYVFIFKMHPAVKNNILRGYVSMPDLTEYKDFYYDLSEYPDVNELLLITDTLITDYSSIIFDYYLINKPIIYFTYDLDEYKSGRGLYFPFEDYIYGEVCETSNELIKAIAKADMFELQRKKFGDKFMSACDGNATKKAIEWIFKD